ncbi:carboxypeptidase [Rhizobium tubonense]|uniref:Carboxypeptidase n=2 Tax=Rhizobium tubonense TaxID=484088 RepID=A0A2W4EDP4_9HYPH|nr:carboxypeptidase [Rhizobium tubonense]PZM12536.1 carboxypeptidase [Rhizobium tubonense]
MVTAAIVVLSLGSAPAFAQQQAPGKTGGGVLGLLPADAVTEHVLNAGGQAIHYEATAGTLDLFGPDGNRTGAIFYTAYVAKNQGGDRPVTFVFNGGPGASSAFLNLGLVGPRVLDFGPGGRDGAKARLVDNPDSWLQSTDLVLIDPIGTGWSRTVKPDDASDFYGVRADAESLAKAIALYVAHNGRASSPKYLLGESYGGLRSAKVASALREQQGILVSGIVMVSPLLEGQFVYGGDGSALSAALQLPSLAAAALERRNAFSEAALADAEKFAIGDYLTTLAGRPPTGDAGKAFYARVAQLTGIPADVVARSNGFLQDVYVKHSIDDGSDVVSSYDASLVAPDPYPESYADRGDDPILDGFTRAYGGAFSSYARDELGFHTDMTYTLLSGAVNGHWDWSGGRGGGGSRFEASATDDIRQLLSLVPSFHMLVAQGYSDLVIPYGINKYVIEHLPPEAAGRVDLKLYRGGHMFYTRPASRAQFSADAKAFFAAPVRSE